jgi:DDB1- and CUL4-associated factor 7
MMEMPAQDKKQIYTHESQWNLYAINFCNRPEKNFRLALGSFIEDTQNKVEIIKLDEEKNNFEHCTYFDHEYPPSKIMWIPDVVSTYNFHNYYRKVRIRT